MTNETSIWYPTDDSKELNRTVRFWIFLIATPPAILCNLFILYHLLTKKNLRQTLNNHALIVLLLLLLVYQLVDIPLHLQFLVNGVTRPSSPILCLIWWFIDWGFFYTITALLSFVSIERHFLIFHSQWYKKRRNRFLLHYFPLISVLMMMLIFYSTAIFSPVCENTFDFTTNLCGTHACYGSIPFFAFVEQVIFSASSSILVALSSSTLLLRVMWQKYRLHHLVSWRKQRKIVFQTVFLSLFYLIFSLPIAIIYLIRLYIDSTWAENYISFFLFCSYFPILLLPYLCLGNVPKISTVVERFRQRIRIVPHN